MIINGGYLLHYKPIKDMLKTKVSDPAFPTSFGLGEIGYDIRIRQSISFIPVDRRPIIVLTDPDTGEKTIEHGRFCLASSIEEFQMPLTLGAVGHDKSTLARLGVQVFNTVVEPGWNGFLTIELVFNGEKEIFIPSGTGIMQMIFHQLKEPRQYEGKYQGQPNAPVPAKTTIET